MRVCLLSQLLLAVSVLLVLTCSEAASSEKKTSSSAASEKKAISNEEEFEEKSFKSKEDLTSYVKTLNAKIEDIGQKPSKRLTEFNSFPDESDLVQEEMKKLRKEELGLRIKLRDIEEEFGVISEEYAAGLHRYGKNLHSQQRYDDLYTIAKEIVRIHEVLDGPEHYHTGRALDNLGTAAYRIKNQEECNTAMYRALHIFMKKFGEESKQVRPTHFYYSLLCQIYFSTLSFATATATWYCY